MQFFSVLHESELLTKKYCFTGSTANVVSSSIFVHQQQTHVNLGFGFCFTKLWQDPIQYCSFIILLNFNIFKINCGQLNFVRHHTVQKSQKQHYRTIVTVSRTSAASLSLWFFPHATGYVKLLKIQCITILDKNEEFWQRKLFKIYRNSSIDLILSDIFVTLLADQYLLLLLVPKGNLMQWHKCHFDAATQ